MTGTDNSSPEEPAPGRSKRKRAAESVTLVVCILQALYWGFKLYGAF
ncbi:hypothetical protein ACFV2Q_35980 [Streptomyces sp. NPDC059650]